MWKIEYKTRLVDENVGDVYWYFFNQETGKTEKFRTHKSAEGTGCPWILCVFI